MEEIKDVVAYAKERHIEIIPEIDMPGHFVAAMAAYPEYSCTPNNPPTIWTTGGISSNVLNVANPQAVQFAKDILSELIELFPLRNHPHRWRRMPHYAMGKQRTLQGALQGAETHQLPTAAKPLHQGNGRLRSVEG